MKALAAIVALTVLIAGAHYLYKSKLISNPTSMTPTSITVTPIEHASLALRSGSTTIFADPVGAPELYASLPRPDIILITHEHGDHFSTSTLEALMSSTTLLVTNPRVAEMLPPELKKNLTVMKNGNSATIGGITISAIAAYNVRPEAEKFHPKGRDNGYIVELGGEKVYIAGDTEGTPEMRALTGIDIAFVPMNLPYTMPVEAAADAVLAFKPRVVYPYHYRGQDGLSDVEKFKSLVAAGDPSIEVVLGDWYK